MSSPGQRRLDSQASRSAIAPAVLATRVDEVDLRRTRQVIHACKHKRQDGGVRKVMRPGKTNGSA